jgi:hypothetical protein
MVTHILTLWVYIALLSGAQALYKHIKKRRK